MDSTLTAGVAAWNRCGNCDHLTPPGANHYCPPKPQLGTLQLPMSDAEIDRIARRVAEIIRG